MGKGKYQPVPEIDHVLRYVRKNQFLRDPETLEITGCSYEAFRLRPADNGSLSCTWLEYFGDGYTQNREQAVSITRNCLTVKKNDGFAVMLVRKVTEVGLRRNRKLRVLQDPMVKEGNPAHCVIRKLPESEDDERDLLDLLASEAVREILDSAGTPVSI